MPLHLKVNSEEKPVDPIGEDSPQVKRFEISDDSSLSSNSDEKHEEANLQVPA